ncbi:mammaglobin-A-like [Ictidomys tridecemlineatus]|uniref:Secretoglobin family 2A member 1 n=1 Tax=Ictidomys tridecemlineatus TaxID=43179 RepID=A0A287D2A8_ICTTR|nr:mammaglobin-A-like [Ictidomys tridecemlineatus]KAG3284885.1 mammaglobin-A-like [Ictidomys tridecemlineatus]
MKLLAVLLLAALPLYCSAGSGCQYLEDVIAKTIDPEVSIEEFLSFIEEFVHNDSTQTAVEEFKQCFLNQSNETLANAQGMMDIMYNSIYCTHF